MFSVTFPGLSCVVLMSVVFAQYPSWESPLARSSITTSIVSFTESGISTVTFFTPLPLESLTETFSVSIVPFFSYPKNSGGTGSITGASLSMRICSCSVLL